MKNSTMFVLIILTIVLIGSFVFVKAGAGITGNVVRENAGNSAGAQQITLTMQGYNYKDITAKAGVPIRINADSTVSGCMRAVVFNIGGKKYTQYLQTENDVLELPALEKGTYSFSCTMGMGFGKLVVK